MNSSDHKEKYCETKDWDMKGDCSIKNRRLNHEPLLTADNSRSWGRITSMECIRKISRVPRSPTSTFHGQKLFSWDSILRAQGMSTFIEYGLRYIG